MMDINEKQLETTIAKIYNINCEYEDCYDCQEKYGVEHCPKYYADEIRDGLKLIRLAMPNVKMIIKNIDKDVK